MKTMNKTTSHRQDATIFWPGTRIVKSMNNAFTQRPDVVMATPAEQAKARSQAAAHTNEQQRAAKKGFGHATIGGLSKRAQKQLRQAQPSISLDPSNNKGARVRKAAI